MIELHLIENKIFYTVVEEFLFTKMVKNNILYNRGLTKFRDNNLAGCLRWMIDTKKKTIINKSIIAKFQETDHSDYIKIIKVYDEKELEKYLLLL